MSMRFTTSTEIYWRLNAPIRYIRHSIKSGFLHTFTQSGVRIAMLNMLVNPVTDSPDR